ncbi:MAG: hypothetical protein ABJB76_04585 [Candidatus Nitrosocosmicus sp.]
MLKTTGLSFEQIVLLDQDELEVIIEYLKEDIDLEEKIDLGKAREFYISHSQD